MPRVRIKEVVDDSATQSEIKWAVSSRRLASEKFRWNVDAYLGVISVALSRLFAQVLLQEESEAGRSYESGIPVGQGGACWLTGFPCL